MSQLEHIGRLLAARKRKRDLRLAFEVRRRAKAVLLAAEERGETDFDKVAMELDAVAAELLDKERAGML